MKRTWQALQKRHESMGARENIAAAFFLLLAISGQAMAQNSSLAWQARDDALSQAGSIAGTIENLYHVPVKEITASNPASFFFSRLVAVHPSANGAMSSREDTAILWSWGESHAPNYTITTLADHPDCPPTKTVFSENGHDTSFAFAFNLTNGNASLVKSISAAGNQNPLPLPFSQAELDSIGPNPQTRRLPWIEARLNATITYHYKVKVYYYVRECLTSADGRATGCGCNSKFRQYNADFVLRDNDSMTAGVENGEPAMAIVRPAGFEQSEGNRTIMAALFSSRNVSGAVAYIDGEAAQITLADYYKAQATPFSWIALATFTENASAGEGAFAFSQNKSEAFRDFSAVANSSGISAYAYEYEISTGFAGLGYHELEIDAYDSLGRKDSYSTHFYKKAGTSLSISCHGENAIANISDSHGSPIPQAMIIVSSASGNYSCTSGQDGSCQAGLGNWNGAASAAFNGNDKYFGSHAQCDAVAQQGGTWTYGIAAAVIAIAGIGLIAKKSWKKS